MTTSISKNTSKLYFCPGCLKCWKDKHKFMLCCDGCKGHMAEKEWTIPLMMEYYGIPGETYGNKPFKIWFPNKKRKPPRDTNGKIIKRIQWNSDFEFDIKPALSFLNSKIGIILQHFIDQQTYYITNLVNEPTKNHWDKLDPEIQYHIDFIKNETVTTLRY